MDTSDLDYDLPADRIARFPLAERTASLLLLLDRATGVITHHRFSELPRLLDPGDLLVRNTSRVLPARLHTRRRSGGKVEVLLVRRIAPETWTALLAPSARIRPGEQLLLPSGGELLVARNAAGERDAPRFTVSSPGLLEEMEAHGQMPIPPYLERPAGPIDRERYQTVFAAQPGSVAAPTAGLHFSPALLEELAARGVRLADVLLHVGPGTFLPVRSSRLEEHRMHEEDFAVGERAASQVATALGSGRRVVALGTTALRALESAASEGYVVPRSGSTRLFITPGYRFRAVTALLTNFHQPRSTLLALVAAFAGLEAIRAAYRAALAGEYRFLSYGDAMLIR